MILEAVEKKTLKHYKKQLQHTLRGLFFTIVLCFVEQEEEEKEADTKR